MVIENKKIAILTQPIHINYGGTLQAYALQKVLKDMGFVVETINYRTKETSDFRKLLSILKQFVKGTNNLQFTSNELKKIQILHSKFIASNLNISSEINDLDELKKYFECNCFNAVIVGSDQVWREEYSPRIESYFLDFLDEDKKIKKISYAASFGMDEWCFSQELTKTLVEYIKEFDAVSVREDSAVNLCKNNLSSIAEHVLDPTLLLDRQDYINLFKDKKSENTGKIFSYILDENEKKVELVQKVSNHLSGKKVFRKQPIKKNKNEIFITDLSDYQYPSIESWLQAFNDTDFIITDSFHGTVFSIIFNKPFIAIKNKERGNSRFESLLKIFGLEDRLVADVTDLDINSLTDIDFERVNQIREYKVKESLNWLKRALV